MTGGRPPVEEDARTILSANRQRVEEEVLAIRSTNTILSTDQQRSAWRLGQALLQLKNSGGELRAFCERVGISVYQARSIRTAAANFSEEQVERFGVEKLRFVARLRLEQRPEILKVAETLSTQELRIYIRDHFPGATRAVCWRGAAGARNGRMVHERKNPVEGVLCPVCQENHVPQEKQLCQRCADTCNRIRHVDSSPHAIAVWAARRARRCEHCRPWPVRKR